VTFYRVFPEPHLLIDELTAEGVSQLTELYESAAPRLIRVNMIVTPQGRTVGADHTSGSLSSPTDRVLVTLLRQMSDAVVLGSATVRQEKIPVPPGIPLVVVSGSGRVPGENLIFRPDSGELVVVTSNPDEARDHLAGHPHRLIAISGGELTPHRLVDLFGAEGWNRVLLEGGQETVTSFVEHSLVDDVCLTLTGAPLDEGSPPVKWWPTGDRFDLVHLLTDDNRMLYHRWVRPPIPEA
jgi:riboflavin biosynthesis pyrimidine reductase